MARFNIRYLKIKSGALRALRKRLIRGIMAIEKFVSRRTFREVSVYPGDVQRTARAVRMMTTSRMMPLSRMTRRRRAVRMIPLLYDPSGRFAHAKRRTLEGARPNAELRVLACLFNEDHAAPLLDLIEASGSSRDAPVSLIVLHLTELVGHAASVLKPHKKS
ncbi:hypothetical protein E2562_005175 [Oryza meyeriana var. granulata]|uniref:Uncharacterized protein n=1 Tax=Oryza meyeriana var. granulata TaxID=110450 RepID=A0A6G1BTV1_9ORYZ|nr:hypothetical protein E2562_005175 [Oryza meyeriana var. granulata]